MIRVSLVLLLTVAGCQPETPPNFLFIVTDDQRNDMLGVVHPILQTPNMDRLASEGVRFENAFVTTPICAASRASLLTGMVERSHGYTFGTPPLSTELAMQSYPALLRKSGYHSAFIGKFGVRVESGITDSLFHVFEPFAAHPYFREDDSGEVRHLTDITADRAIEYLKSRNTSSPFALTLSFNAPHADDGEEQQFFWPEAVDSLYTEQNLPNPPQSDPVFFEAQPDFLKEASLNRVRWYWRFDSAEKTDAMTKGYYRMISGVDAAVGRILSTLEEIGLSDNTVVILMGDNGYFLGERGYAGKWLPLEPSIRVPLIVMDPRSKLHGSIPNQPVLNTDIAPTLLDLAGVAASEFFQGQSLRPFLEGDSPEDWRTEFFVEHLFNHPQIPKHEGVRGDRFKYARYFEQEPVYEELYDLENDPAEAINLAMDPDHADILNALRSRTDDMVADYTGPHTANHRIMERPQ